MTCDRLELPGGSVAIICGPRRRQPRPKAPATCNRCKEPFTAPRKGIRTLCPDCIADLS